MTIPAVGHTVAAHHRRGNRRRHESLSHGRPSGVVGRAASTRTRTCGCAAVDADASGQPLAENDTRPRRLGRRLHRNTYLHGTFLRLKSRRGPKKAMLAVAAPMLTKAYCIKTTRPTTSSVPTTLSTATKLRSLDAPFVARRMGSVRGGQARGVTLTRFFLEIDLDAEFQQPSLQNLQRALPRDSVRVIQRQHRVRVE
jgi:hypothetical protein